VAKELEYPWQRDEIRDLIEVALDTPEARRNYPQGFDEWIEDLDDLTLDGAHVVFGRSLRTTTEVDAVYAFLDCRNSMLVSCHDFDALESHPRWPELVARAHTAVTVLAPDSN